MKKAPTGIDRRGFLRLLAGVPLLGVLGSVGIAEAEARRYAKLVDTTKCIGCKRCMSACKRWNKLKVERLETVTDRKTDLSAHNWTVVNLRTDSMNREQRTYVKWQCQHCDKPACAGVCPVTAITKLPSGPVVINEKKCIGCMYCYQACPYKVPRFDSEKRVARKCTLCYDRIPLLNYMKPACVAACPVRAISFDYKHIIIKDAKKRIQRLKNPGYILGLREAGGTDVLTILPSRPQNLGLVVAPEKVINQDLDKIRITAAGFMGASVLAGLMYVFATLTRKKDKRDHEEPD
jgi:formate dehydrogenase iron-sulfur subunit